MRVNRVERGLKFATIVTCAGLAVVLGVASAQAQQKLKSAFDPSAPAADPRRKAEAEALARKLWDNQLQTCGGSVVQQVNDRLLIELEQPTYQLVAMRHPDAAKEAGYEFRGVALASAKRWRWATQTSGRLEWSDWAPGETTVVRDDNLTLDRGFTAVPDVVLKFDIVRKDGAWKANAPISSLSYAIRPIDPEAPAPTAPPPPCPAQVAAK